ncbi:hypothetical protein DFH07DRAFT_777388 [Mycena maculata]|uniref:Uncharacterized protein n=1 Tax=Mycena maculata TaxID=230809 RepID=A0AAD7IHU9_9AGAR|nr:hypothetical protein DFH07DRAFT_777388 [Mycena maculata]
MYREVGQGPTRAAKWTRAGTRITKMSWEEAATRCYVKGRRPGAGKGRETGPVQAQESQKQAGKLLPGKKARGQQGLQNGPRTGKKLLPGALGTASRRIVAMEGADRCYVKGRRPWASKGHEMGLAQAPESKNELGEKQWCYQMKYLRVLRWECLEVLTVWESNEGPHGFDQKPTEDKIPLD